MLKIVLTRSMVPSDIQYIKNGLDQEIAGKYEFVVPKTFSEEYICAEAVDADVLLGPYVTSKILENAKNLKLIQVPWTGMDTFDFQAVKGFDVPVCNTHSNADAVAELGICLVLDLLKKASYHDRKMRNGNWNRDQKPLNLKARILSKQTVCVLGFGNIGSRIGKLIEVFGAEVIAVDDRAKAGENAEQIFRNGEIDEALGIADVVICTLPLTDSTKALINADRFSVMKDGVLFVNMSRAAVVDEDAAWTALENGKLGGFASDVWWNAPRRGESESYPSTKYEWWKRDNVVMSPHRAGFVEGCLPHLDGAIKNIIALSEGKPLEGIVNVNNGY